jgi:hypothetical protein
VLNIVQKKKIIKTDRKREWEDEKEGTERVERGREGYIF